MRSVKDDNTERYLRALHAMGAGVDLEMHKTAAHTPKQLRIGVNSNFVSQKAIAELLIKKGIITLEEYFEAHADAMEEEVKIYEKKNGVRLL